MSNNSKALVFIASLLTVSSVFAQFHRAVYEVPSADSAVSSTTQFEMQNVFVMKTADHQTMIRYTLPLQLTGQINTFEFKTQPDGSLAYDNDEMKCDEQDQQLVCTVKFTNLKLDNLRAQMIIQKRFEGEELSRRIEAQARFSTDPVGVITIQLCTQPLL